MRDTQRRKKEKAKMLRELMSLVRRLNLQVVYGVTLRHVGGKMLIIDILGILHFTALRINPSLPNATERDRFILSKDCSADALSRNREAFCEGWHSAVTRALLDSPMPASNVTSF